MAHHELEQPGHEGGDQPGIALKIHNDRVPIRIGEDGDATVGGTRVNLGTVVMAFEDGADPEEIVNRFPTLRLADVFSVVGYYLRHREEIQAYMKQEEHEAEKLRDEIEARWPSEGLRERLLARLAERKQPDGESGPALDAETGR